MGLFDLFKKKKSGPMYLYCEQELKELDEFIGKEFGRFENVFHEIASPDIHLDVCICEPKDKPYIALVTMGAGAFSMPIPEQWKKYDIDRAEYVIYIPKNWNWNSSAMEDYWPIKVLKDTARLPIACDTWLSFGHTAQGDEEGSAYAPNTRLNSVVLDFVENKNGAVRMKLSSGKTINFYIVIPLYPEELAFKMQSDAEALFKKFEEQDIMYRLVDPNRKSAI